MLTQERLKELLSYDPETGIFVRLIRTSSRANIGQIAGSLKRGYKVILVLRKSYMAHRLAWLYIHGVFPQNHIDHINGIKDDNRMVNLREVTPAQNQQNRVKSKDNKSGFLGVSYNMRNEKFVANICLNRKIHYLGLFDTAEEASEAYKKKKKNIHLLNPIIRVGHTTWHLWMTG
jgi:HNH endonuclease